MNDIANFYAYEGGVTTDPDNGNVKITLDEYRTAIESMSSGKIVSISNGKLELIDHEPPKLLQYVLDGKILNAYEKPDGAELYNDDWYFDGEKYFKKR